MPETWLIVGASRGIGHECVRQLLANGNRVLATVRSDAVTPQDLWSVEDREATQCQLFQCDVTSEQSIKTFVDKLSGLPNLSIDYAVINAGVLKYPNRATEMSFDRFLFHLQTNTVGPIITAQQLLRQVPVKSITFVSSDSGSTTNFLEKEDGFAAYGASKAALNQALRHMAAELKRKDSKTVILAVHPGEVKTDMANIDLGWNVEGQMTPEESVLAVLRVVTSKTLQDSGTFWTWENQPYPW